MNSSHHYACVGDRPDNYQEWETLKYRLHGFESMPKRKGHAIVTTSELTCFGRQWALMVYPGGANEAKHGMISVFLKQCCNKCGINLQVAMGIKQDDGISSANVPRVDTYDFPPSSAPWGWSDFIQRSAAVDALVDGTLVIDVCMKPTEAIHKLPFTPQNPFFDVMRKMFLDERYADVLFEVESQEGEQEEDTKPPPVSFHAHKMILKECAPALADICESCEDLTPVLITDIRQDVFRHLLGYVYGRNVPAEELEKSAKEFINAANMYGVVNLKLEAEASYAMSTEITVDNVMDTLLYADAKNCALLKELALDFIAENGDDVLDRVKFDDIPGNLFRDLLVATTRREKKEVPAGIGDDEADFRTMRVNTLRRKVYAKGANVDGSRETLIAVLKDFS